MESCGGLACRMVCHHARSHPLLLCTCDISAVGLPSVDEAVEISRGNSLSQVRGGSQFTATEERGRGRNKLRPSRERRGRSKLRPSRERHCGRVADGRGGRVAVYCDRNGGGGEGRGRNKLRPSRERRGERVAGGRAAGGLRGRVAVYCDRDEGGGEGRGRNKLRPSRERLVWQSLQRTKT